MKYSQRPLKGWNWLVGLYNLTFFSNKGLFVYLSILSLTTVKMPPKNKVHVSVIQVREVNENPITEPPVEEEEETIESPPSTGQQIYLDVQNCT